MNKQKNKELIDKTTLVFGILLLSILSFALGVGYVNLLDTAEESLICYKSMEYLSETYLDILYGFANKCFPEEMELADKIVCQEILENKQ